jgi:hypothetical protein
MPTTFSLLPASYVYIYLAVGKYIDYGAYTHTQTHAHAHTHAHTHTHTAKSLRSNHQDRLQNRNKILALK